MKNTIQLTVKSVYGNDLIYPNCKTSLLFADLICKKTFNKRDETLIRKLGYSIEYTL